jgi:hypothetical protein
MAGLPSQPAVARLLLVAGAGARLAPAVLAGSLKRCLLRRTCKLLKSISHVSLSPSLYVIHTVTAIQTRLNGSTEFEVGFNLNPTSIFQTILLLSSRDAMAQTRTSLLI